LEESQRPGKVPLRVAFCQRGHGPQTEPGLLAQFSRRGRESALDQYLLALAWASKSPFDVARDSRIWARACGLGTGESGRAAVSRNWKFMRSIGLVEVERRGRLASVKLLREDGSGESYVHPGTLKQRYFRLPFEYWTEGDYHRLTLPGKVLLLVALSLPDQFYLPADRGPGWYGMSASTIERGLRELRRQGILNAVRERRIAPLAPEGFTIVNLYTLEPPFGPKGRPQSQPAAEGVIQI
jgi:hypothetical protein